MKAPIPQVLTGSPNYFGLLNNLMALIICESLREIGEMACVTSAWSSRRQTLNIYLFKSLSLSQCLIHSQIPLKQGRWKLKCLVLLYDISFRKKCRSFFLLLLFSKIFEVTIYKIITLSH